MFYASFSKRSAAFIIDMCFIAAVILVFRYYYFALTGEPDILISFIFGNEFYPRPHTFKIQSIFTVRQLPFCAFHLSFFLLYFAVMESSGQKASFGKRICGIKVTDFDGERISFTRALLRATLKGVSLLTGIGWILYFFTARLQTFHDKITGTIVMRSVYSINELHTLPWEHAGEFSREFKWNLR